MTTSTSHPRVENTHKWFLKGKIHPNIHMPSYSLKLQFLKRVSPLTKKQRETLSYWCVFIDTECYRVDLPSVLYQPFIPWWQYTVCVLHDDQKSDYMGIHFYSCTQYYGDNNTVAKWKAVNDVLSTDISTKYWRIKHNYSFLFVAAPSHCAAMWHWYI